MNSYEENIPLTQEEISKIRIIFSQVSFDQLKINKYFFKPHLSDYSENSRHGFTVEEVKKFYAQPQLISRGFKRKSKTGYQYTLCYQKIDAPPHIKKCGLIGARFLDAQSVSRPKWCDYQTL